MWKYQVSGDFSSSLTRELNAEGDGTDSRSPSLLFPTAALNRLSDASWATEGPHTSPALQFHFFFFFLLDLTLQPGFILSIIDLIQVRRACVGYLHLHTSWSCLASCETHIKPVNVHHLCVGSGFNECIQPMLQKNHELKKCYKRRCQWKIMLF